MKPFHTNKRWEALVVVNIEMETGKILRDSVGEEEELGEEEEEENIIQAKAAARSVV